MFPSDWVMVTFSNHYFYTKVHSLVIVCRLKPCQWFQVTVSVCWWPRLGSARGFSNCGKVSNLSLCLQTTFCDVLAIVFIFNIMKYDQYVRIHFYTIANTTLSQSKMNTCRCKSIVTLNIDCVQINHVQMILYYLFHNQ